MTAATIKSMEVVDPATGQKYQFVVPASLDANNNAVTTNAGDPATAIVYPDEPAKAESWYYDDGVTASTVAALFTTTDVSLFCPYDTLTFTKSAASESATVTLRLRPGSVGVLVISGLTTETIAVTGTINSIATGSLMVRDGAGTINTIIAASALSNCRLARMMRV